MTSLTVLLPPTGDCCGAGLFFLPNPNVNDLSYSCRKCPLPPVTMSAGLPYAASLATWAVATCATVSIEAGSVPATVTTVEPTVAVMI